MRSTIKGELFGIRDMQVKFGQEEATTITLELMASPGYNPMHIYEERNWNDKFPGDVIVKCGHCGQWAAVKTSCRYCGAPV